ncbi:uncharacterized protein JN550_013690 [Neoarthrinium moseri]|uniref:uncharacterized protein n=1 Tax=Neoarthrinium moseri TaxID=1658444 RepID=UPI001FDD75C0|nr:uncharacterized protein JN550_013690 [Neoarthrinium moseri]KAI1856696.1 hypothetical protein JN550_013690 [Neoarthrinium moseri]
MLFPSPSPPPPSRPDMMSNVKPLVKAHARAMEEDGWQTNPGTTPMSSSSKKDTSGETTDLSQQGRASSPESFVSGADSATDKESNDPSKTVQLKSTLEDDGREKRTAEDADEIGQYEGWVEEARGMQRGLLKYGPPVPAKTGLFRYGSPVSAKKVLLRYGPPAFAKYWIQIANGVKTAITSGDMQNLSLNRPGEERKACEGYRKGPHVVPEGSIVSVLGVGWEYGDNEKDPIGLLNPMNWGTGRRQPYTLVKVKMHVPSDDHSPGEHTVSWETRSTIERIMGKEKITLGKSVELDGKVLFEKSQPIGKSDAYIIMAAVRCEVRYRGWMDEKREASC